MICHHYQCIFVHVPKTAGMSIEFFFLSLLGLTWDTRGPLLLGDNLKPWKPELGPIHLPHLKAEEYVKCQYVPQEMFDKYFIFSFVRNPWDRMVSIYKWLSFSKLCDFKTFIMDRVWNELLDRKYYWMIKPQYNFIFDKDGKQLVDFIGRYENLHDDFNEVCKNIGLSSHELPVVNRAAVLTKTKLSLKRLRYLCTKRKWNNLLEELSYNCKNKYSPHYDDFREYYDKESMEFVKHFYRKDVETFGYTFEDNHILV